MQLRIFDSKLLKFALTLPKDKAISLNSQSHCLAVQYVKSKKGGRPYMESYSYGFYETFFGMHRMFVVSEQYSKYCQRESTKEKSVKTVGQILKEYYGIQ